MGESDDESEDESEGESENESESEDESEDEDESESESESESEGDSDRESESERGVCVYARKQGRGRRRAGPVRGVAGGLRDAWWGVRVCVGEWGGARVRVGDPYVSVTCKKLNELWATGLAVPGAGAGQLGGPGANLRGCWSPRALHEVDFNLI